jgi:bacterioferritin (cytochrome b1)
MGFDFDRSDLKLDPADAGGSESAIQQMQQLLEDNLAAERALIRSCRCIAAAGTPDDTAALRLIKVVLAVEEEHVEIIAAMRDSLRELKACVSIGTYGKAG